MTAEEKDELLAPIIPTIRRRGVRRTAVGPNKGDKVLQELAALLQGDPRLAEEIDLSQPDYDVDVLIIGGGGAGASAAIEADNAARTS